jgi:hypothetical protein
MVANIQDVYFQLLFFLCYKKTIFLYMFFLLKAIGKILIIKPKKSKEKMSHQMYEENHCNKFLSHMIYELALKICGDGTRKS